ncbi:DUF6366 family protein [Bacillus sp. J33]|uniref:DUF6366 family protein n=1 Tax=Bacillus sp. J33 TaxID=935836 RepID=UPI00047DCB7A|nr:DUF6366 family protein [Bacillus sp. J33]
MNNHNETPEDKREQLRQSELKNNPTGSLQDSLNRGANGNLTDLTGSLGWKGTGIVIIGLIVGIVIYKLIF